MLGLEVCTAIPGYPTFYTVIKVQAGFPYSFISSSHRIECSKLLLQLSLTHIGLVKCGHDEARFRNCLVVGVVVVKRNGPSEAVVVAVGSSDSLVHSSCPGEAMLLDCPRQKACVWWRPWSSVYLQMEEF